MSALKLNIELYTHPITFPQNKAETNAIRKIFYQMAYDWHKKSMDNFFNIFSDLDDLYKKSDSYADQVRQEAINQAMKFLAAHEIYDITEQQFYQQFMSDYDTWEEDFSIIANQYEVIVEKTENLHAYRTARRQNRDKWVGYNARGEGEAFAKNLTSNIGHGVFNLAAAGLNAIGDSIKKNDIFKSQSTLNQVAEGTYSIVIAAFEATIDAINSEISNTFHKYSVEEASKVEAIVEGINSGRIPEDKILPSLIKAVQLYPYNRDTYILFLSNFGDHDRSLETVMNYFGITSLSNEKKKIFELKRSKYSLISFQDCKTHLPILEDYAKSIGYEEFKEESRTLLEAAIKQEFDKRRGSTDFSTILACKANIPLLQEFANEIGYQDFEKDSTEILNRAIESDFKLKLEATNLTTIPACKANIPLLQEFANEIGYRDFEKDSTEILNRAIESDFLLEASKYDLKSLKSYEANISKLKNFATDIGYQKFDVWAAKIQTKAKPKTTLVIFGYLAILIIGCLIFNEQFAASGFMLCSFLFILGLVSPKLALWWGGEKTRFRVIKIYSLLILLSFVITGFFAN
ncbi:MULTISPECIES: hypothetical protein [unclassified Acinetobacter]|uniref:hypothetical protein n=1 Tax=unclassified Acinetobacter TaxID=196816 RepID=UPI00051BE426|nr:hypothetical protein [Acinetobacter sp. MN12]